MIQKLNRLLHPYLWVSLLIPLLCAAVSVYFQQYYLSAFEAGGALLLFLYAEINAGTQRKKVTALIESTVDSMEIAHQSESPVPKVVFDADTGEILWASEQFVKVTGFPEPLSGSHIQDLMPDLDYSFLSAAPAKIPPEYPIRNRRYHLYGNITLAEKDSRRLANLFFINMTRYLAMQDEYIRSRPVVSMILIDNYDELTNNQPDNDVSALNVEINTAILNWTSGCSGLLRKVERNRYLFIFEHKYLQELIDGNFSILEEIHKVVNNAGIHASISLGIGRQGSSFEESYSFASLSVEMALSRGGDQAVIKDRKDFTFYGAHGKETGSHTKVKARTIANTLYNLIRQSSSVYIMGHANADLDVLGAASGIMALCRKAGTTARIVIDLQQNAVQALLAELMPLEQYKDAFVSGEQALLEADSKSLLVIVDTNRPDQVQYLPLLRSMSKVAVIDHHRRAADYIENTVLQLHETTASSASELVAELLQYAADPSDILPQEAVAVLSGIVLDTKQFSVRTGDRTFEAAAFLHRLGADPTEVKKLLQSDFSTAVKRYEIIQHAEIYRTGVAISVSEKDLGRVTAAQAADELINISDIGCSFVVFPSADRIAISARSIGEINVQLILEELGGGGNPATAGAQIPGQTLSEVVVRLKQAIDRYFTDSSEAAKAKE